MASAESLGDTLATMLLAGVVLNGSALGVVVLLVVHATLALTSRGSPRAWTGLAIAWWSVGVMALVAAAVLVPASSRRAQTHRGLDAVFFVLPLFTAAMGALARWTGARVDRRPQAAPSRVASRAVAIAVLVTLVIVGVGAWITYTARQTRLRAEATEAEVRRADDDDE